MGPDGTGSFIAFLTAGHETIIISFTVAEDGSFSGQSPASGAARAGVAVPRAVSGFSGSISGGQVTGTADGAGFSGSQDPSSGPEAPLAGYYVEHALYSDAGASYTVVGSSGSVLTVIVTPASSDAASGTIGGSGQLTATTQAGATLNLAVSGQGATATLTAASSGSPVGFSGLNSTTASTTRLINLSVRGVVGTGPSILIEGFVTSGTSSGSVLLRGIGPTLSSFNVPGVLAAPQLTLFDAHGTSLGSVTSWGGSSTLMQAFTQTGAFALPSGSADAATLQVLPAGPYTVQLVGIGGTTGVGLTELYDANLGQSGPRLINISARGAVGTGGNILIAGFAISGNAPETVLVRGIGPSLAQFSLTGTLTSPQLTLFDAAGKVLDSNAGWGGSAALSAVFSEVGAFPIPAGSSDAVILVTLPPGAYTVQLSGANGQTGIALVEVYEVP